MSKSELATLIHTWGQELGFQQLGITDCNLTSYKKQFLEWISNEFHGEMDYMERNMDLRFNPEQLVPGTKRIIMVRMNYLPPLSPKQGLQTDPQKAAIAYYALGGDYHRFMRKRLERLAQKITEYHGKFTYRAFADSAPVLEKPLAQKAGLGWIGKNTLLINPKAGSWFFLGALFVDLDLPIDNPMPASHCGSCTACIDICPTKAIVAPYKLDARKCIAYLTIEYKGSIPEDLRPQMGNKIFGCDDCQLICPWNKFAQNNTEGHFTPRIKPNGEDLINLFKWTPEQFDKNTLGSALRRTGYQSWQRNIAIALGNANYTPEIVKILTEHQEHPDDIVREHVIWALKQQLARQKN